MIYSSIFFKRWCPFVNVCRIEELTKKDKEKQALAKAKNDLETFVVDMQDKLWQEKWEKASTEGERQDIRDKLSAASDWLYEQEDDTDKSVSESETRVIWVKVGVARRSYFSSSRVGDFS